MWTELKFFTATLLLLGSSLTAAAQDLVYEPVNPSFGGNSFNSAHLLALANAQNDFERPVTESTTDDLDRFIRSLQSRLLSSLSTQVANAIFGEDAQDNGVITFGDQTVSFVTTLDGIELTITDSDGTVTRITIPTLQTTDQTDQDEDADADAKTSNVSFGNSVSIKIGDLTPLETGSLARAEGSLTNSPLSSGSSLQPIHQPIQ